MTGGSNNSWLQRVMGILRLISLSILSGGSAAIVFAAVTLVKAAQAQGVPTPEAAAANAPVFVHFSKVVLGAGIMLLLAEAVDFATRRTRSKLVVSRYAASLLCVATTMVFALGIVPPMAELLPLMKAQSGMAAGEVARIHASFHSLHEISRMVFSGTILLAFVSLILPVLDSDSPQ